MVEADRADRVEAGEIVFVGRVGCRARRPRRAASGRGRSPTARPGTSAPARSARRGPRTRRPASGSRADWQGRSSRSARARAGATARRGSRTHSRAPRRPAASTRNRTPRGITAISPGADRQPAQLGGQRQPALLRHDQQLAIGIPEHPLHRPGGAVDVHRHAGAGLRVAVGQHRHQPGDEIRRRSRQRQRIPTQPVRGVGLRQRACTASRCRSRRYGRWPAEGRMRYSQDRRDSRRGTVNGVPDNCSAYSPSGGRCGEFCPTGNAPATPHWRCSLPKPER